MQERLQKYMARCGVASRRKCEEIILSGRVLVNGIKITELGTKISPGNDIIEIDGKKILPEEEKVYIILNKPEGYITSVSDEKGRKTVLELINVNERIFPIGRLDYNTSGLLLLTNDGEIYNKVIHPRVEVKKTYIAKVNGVFTESEMKKFRSGVDIGDYITAPANIKMLSSNKNTCKVEIKIHEGKNRQIRRMCDKFNHKVLELKRVKLGKLTLNSLKKGEWRYLTKEEIEYLYNL